MVGGLDFDQDPMPIAWSIVAARIDLHTGHYCSTNPS